MAHNNHERLKFLTELLKFFTALITFITLLGLPAGLVRLWQGHRDVMTIVLLMIGVGSTCVIVYRRYQQTRPPSKLILLVANFDGLQPQQYRVTETVLARLRAALAQYRAVEVQTLGRAISEVKGSAVARAEGQRRKATIVIWELVWADREGCTAERAL